MHTLINPGELAPAASYSHGVLVSGEARWLAIAGQGAVICKATSRSVSRRKPRSPGVTSTASCAALA